MTENGIFYDLEYINLTYGGNSRLNIEITDTDGKVKDLKPRSTCGCTISEISREGNVYNLSIVYDSLRKGGFTKQVQVTYKEGWSNKKLVFNIKGHI